jgi:hypothetical protein
MTFIAEQVDGLVILMFVAGVIAGVLLFVAVHI